MNQRTRTEAGKGSIMNPDFAGTDPAKVKQQIQKDVSAGKGAMTSREAGAMNGDE